MKRKAVILGLLLLAVGLGAAEKKYPTIKFSTDPVSGFYTIPITEISYSKCEVCGRDVPGPVLVIQLPRNHWSKESDEAFKKSILPYTKGEYRVCWRCILEALKIKPEVAK
jgi:hypothetical protein